MSDRELTPDEMRTLIEAAPEPLVGKPIWDRFSGGDGYDASAKSLARAMLTCIDDDPSLLDVPEDDPTGWDAATNDPLWQAVKARFPNIDPWLSGCSGFQFGWAHNAVRYAVGAKPVGNPAIVTLADETQEQER